MRTAVIAAILAEAINEAKGEPIPTGPLYAACAGVVSLDLFNRALTVLHEVGLIERVGSFRVKGTAKLDEACRGRQALHAA